MTAYPAVTNRLNVLLGSDQALKGFYHDLLDKVLGVLSRTQGTDRTIPIWKGTIARKEIADYVNVAFMGTHAMPFGRQSGRVYPDSAYARALWDGMARGARVGVEEHREIMNRCLKDAPDLRNAYLRATRNPFQKDPVSELGPFSPDPNATYSPLHEWVDPSGYKLSDRIWRATGDTRRKLDLFLNEAIASGQGSKEMSHDLEDFLLPDRALIRTNRPYGTDLSFDGMRLARTEIASAHARAGAIAAASNPFVETYDIRLSGSHPILDECDDAVAAGPYTKYDFDSLPPLHPFCLCVAIWNVSGDINDIIAQGRANLDMARLGEVGAEDSAFNFLNPLRLDSFVDAILNGL